jgi:hypothetical protein
LKYSKLLKSWSREWELNPRPADYESAALPLSYLGSDNKGLPKHSRFPDAPDRAPEQKKDSKLILTLSDFLRKVLSLRVFGVEHGV